MSLGGWVGFYGWERRASHPILELEIFKNRTFAFSNLAALISYTAAFSVSFLLSLYLQYIKGFSPWETGLILMVQPACR